MKPDQPKRPDEDRMTEIDVEAGARRTAPGRPPDSAHRGPAPHGDAPGAGIRGAEHPAPGTSEESAVVIGIAPADDPD